MTSTPPMPPASDIVSFGFDSSRQVTSVKIADDWPRKVSPEEFPAGVMMAYVLQKEGSVTAAPAEPDSWIDIPEGDLRVQVQADVARLGAEVKQALREAEALAGVMPTQPQSDRYSDRRRHVTVVTFNGMVGTAEISPQWLRSADPNEVEVALLEALQAAEAGAMESPTGRVAARLAALRQRQQQMATLLHDFERSN